MTLRKRAIVLALILTSVSACIASTAAVNEFCTIVGPPPKSMIPAPDAPETIEKTWIYTFLAVYDVAC